MAAATPSAVIDYRPEIDGLRALAVLPVILFHAHVGPFTGGFIGVDVFFVISGFLITSILLREQAEGQFSMARFYARRARRILPALAVVLLACLPVAWQALDTEALADFGWMLAATALAGSNFLLAATTGYFDGPAELRPLLHTWSLAVEEQFYLVFPLYLLAVAHWPRRRAALGLGLIALASLALAQWGTGAYTQANFFLAPGRVWELAVGCLCAYVVSARQPVTVPLMLRQGLAAVGLAAIVASCLALNASTPSPGVQIVPAVLGTAAVLLWGTQDTWVGRVLALRPLVTIGLISYSAYLWHQPLLAFARHLHEGPLPGRWRVALIAATLVLAALTWRLVEQPFRLSWRGAAPRRVLLVAGGVMAALVVAGAALAVSAPVLRPPMPAAVQAAFQPPARTQACFDRPFAHREPQNWCRIDGAAGARPSFLLFGDSHALQVLDAFQAAAQQAGRSGVFTGFSGCAPLLGVVPLTRPDQTRMDCAALNQQALAFARENGIRDVYLVAKWSYYTDPWLGGSYLNAIGLAPGAPITVASSRAAFETGFLATARAYAAAGIRLHVIEQVPQQMHDPRATYRLAHRADDGGASVLQARAVSREAHRALQAFPSGVFHRAGLPPLDVLNFDDLFCDATRCPAGVPGMPYYMDHSHLSAAGAERLVPRLADRLRAGLR